MYVVTQLYHDYDPKGDCPIDSQFVDMYNVIGLFKTFDKAVERAKQINKDFEMDCASRLSMKYEDLKKAINNKDNVDYFQDYNELFKKEYSFIENSIIYNKDNFNIFEYSKIIIENIEIEE